MTKYRIVGVVNFLLGFLEIIYPLILIFFTMPKMYELYAQFHAEVPSPVVSYLILTLVFILGIVNVFLGIKLFSKSAGRDSYFTFAIILIAASFLSYWIFSTATTLSSVIMPMSALTSDF
ncbi:MAG: hypothetical protein A2785_01290 [Candidatus Chisholmbacteria bacterium RIFCSPHIGHO2_01_FULL_49_18]|uniref:Uncharacterized protein n=2 Tax=Candidatus Chisholmiibacteriota TaxID=1817900 RepID=A0A1G1VLB6_9BACT|nr:MAG: hypothetical protein A2785_01290 [Candidatus Chisholmbacteria bacterium RIFCSPHIGHO2_01_FULL_49_18]OGY21820.1 MAG: hypothetical protein A3A65_02530 [Candidatus Chisholmbacteria bacterium RIFCSPLOWO2_01_FULL_49_14]